MSASDALNSKSLWLQTHNVRYPEKAAGFSHIATVLKEMVNEIDTKKLSKVADIYDDTPLAQRVGYLIETQLARVSMVDLHQWLKQRSCSLVRLSGKRKGKEIERNKKWQIIRDIDVEADEI